MLLSHEIYVINIPCLSCSETTIAYYQTAACRSNIALFAFYCLLHVLKSQFTAYQRDILAFTFVHSLHKMQINVLPSDRNRSMTLSRTLILLI